MSENTRRLMGDPPPGRTPWADAAQADRQTSERFEAHLAEPRQRPGRAEREMAKASAVRPNDNSSLGRPEAIAKLAVAPGMSTNILSATPPTPDQTAKLAVCSTVPTDKLSDGLREIRPIDVSHLKLTPPATGEPIFERVDPRTLLVDGSYQRDLSPASLKLIERIAANWDWRRFKPPVVAFADGGLQIIDGQHTSIAAASRPDIQAIPIMVVEAPAIEARAGAFIGHNKDRLAVSAMQLHHAAVAAGDLEALAIENVCHEAGVGLVRSPYGTYRYKVGESIAIGAIGTLIKAQGVARTRELLKVLVSAGLAPIRADHIKAVELLFSDPDYRDNLEPLPVGGQDMATAIQISGEQAIKDAKVFAAAQAVPLWKALAITWFRKSRKRRKVA